MNKFIKINDEEVYVNKDFVVKIENVVMRKDQERPTKIPYIVLITGHTLISKYSFDETVFLLTGERAIAQ